MRQDATYAECVNQMVEALRVFAYTGPLALSMAEAEKVKHTLDMADSLGPVLHPSEWMKAADLDRQKKLVEVYLRTCRELRDIFPDDPIVQEVLAS